MEVPEYLYHYTTINSLAMILSTKSFRFTRLNNLNDPKEGVTSDINGSEEMIYCSSWTAHEKDTIPLWKMYTNLIGVRLRMPVNMFCGDNRIETSKVESFSYQTSKLPEYVMLELDSAINGRQTIAPTNKIYGPDRIDYNKSGV